MNNSSSNNSSGQALLIILLAMAAVVTITLSIVSRSVSDIALTTSQEDSLRAFSAAEAGIEETLVQNLDIGSSTGEVVVSGTPGGGDEVVYNADVSGFPESTNQYAFPLDLLSGDAATIWFVEHNPDGSLSDSTYFSGPRIRFCWGKSGTSSSDAETPAIEIAVYYISDSTGTLQSVVAAFDPNSSRIPINNFSSARGACSVAGQNYQFSTRNLRFQNDLGLSSSERSSIKAARVKMLYNETNSQSLGVRVQGGSLPAQGRTIESAGSAGDSNRKVVVYELYADMPSLFDTAVYSKSDIVK